jgi:hypothetical protein
MVSAQHLLSPFCENVIRLLCRPNALNAEVAHFYVDELPKEPASAEALRWDRSEPQNANNAGGG